MTDVNAIASRYIDLWNERTPSRRRDILSQHWAKDAKYVDPLMSGEGHDGVDALIAGVQQRFPDFRCRQPDKRHGFRRRQRRTYPQHHRISRSDPATRVTMAMRLPRSSGAVLLTPCAATAVSVALNFDAGFSRLKEVTKS